MKVDFLLTSSYPTEKAYGVTTSETAKAIREMGIDTRILSVGSSNSDSAQNHIVLLNSYATNLLTKTLQLDIKYLNYLVFKGRALLLGRLMLKECARNATDIVWTRDLYVAFLFSLRKRRGILELHQNPNFIVQKILKILRKDFVIATISDDHYSKLQRLHLKNEIIILPMSVPNSFFTSSGKKFNKREIYEICYLGKFKSSGNDNAILSLIEDIKEASINIRLHIIFIGIEKNYQSIIRKSLQDIEKKNLSFEILDHIEHNKLPKILSRCDIGVVPYIKSKYNNERFPIKLVEYAATRLCILASDTPNLRNILGEDKAYYYDPTNKGSLEKTLDKIINNLEETNSKINCAFNWAKGLTYEERVKKALRKLEKNEI